MLELGGGGGGSSPGKVSVIFNPIQTGGRGVDATQDLNPLLLTNGYVYGVPTS